MTPGPDDLPWETLAAFLAGELSDNERARVHAWLAADPQREELLVGLREVWDRSAAHRRRYDVEAALERLKQQAAAMPGAPDRAGERSVPARPTRRPSFRPAASAGARPLDRLLLAASIAAVALGGWWLASQLPPGAARGASSQLAAREYRTPRGQRLAFQLADGSSVLLGPASVLRVHPAYGARSRTVALTGEAYFEVTHDAARPFAVHTARAVARDLGTRFVVRAYADDPVTDVVVAEGKVALDARVSDDRLVPDRPVPDSLVLEPGHRGRVTEEGALMLARQVSLDSYFGWTEGRLVFRDTPLPDALRQLGRWYDVEIWLAAPGLRGRTLTAAFRDEPAPEAVRLVAASFGLRAERDGAAFVLTAAAR